MNFSVNKYAKVATAIFSVQEFERVMTPPLVLDDLGRLMGVEMVALPGTPFEVVDEKTGEVKTPVYPSEKKLFIDLRCLGGEKRVFRLPKQEEMIEKMVSREGARYIWGGNVGAGLPHHLEWYGGKSEKEREIVALKGVDCSGLMYEAADGLVPRNTSELVNFGREVGRGEALQPLDLIVWDGHVIIVISEDEVIEARAQQGNVFRSPLAKRLEEARIEAPDLKINRWFGL